MYKQVVHCTLYSKAFKISQIPGFLLSKHKLLLTATVALDVSDNLLKHGLASSVCPGVLVEASSRWTPSPPLTH